MFPFLSSNIRVNVCHQERCLKKKSFTVRNCIDIFNNIDVNIEEKIAYYNEPNEIFIIEQ